MTFIAGYACTFNEPTEVDDFVEVVRPGAFDLSTGRDVRMIFGTHDNPAAFARTSNGSLEFFQDRHGLGFRARLNGAVVGASAIARAIAAGETTRASVNFIHVEAERALHDGRDHRFIKRARIDHVAIVSAATYAGTAVWLQDANDEVLSPRLAELRKKWSGGAIQQHAFRARA